MAGSINSLSLYRYERAKEELENAQNILESGKFKLALNRSYYSIFLPPKPGEQSLPLVGQLWIEGFFYTFRTNMS